MRDIKFRAWNGSHMNKAFDLTQNPIFWWKDNYDYPLMQYTGLKGKNGVEIYEGDIVKSPSYPEPYQTSEVFFQDGSFATYLDGTRLGAGLGWIELSQNSFNDSFEVIGNIYENPELLKENK